MFIYRIGYDKGRGNINIIQINLNTLTKFNKEDMKERIERFDKYMKHRQLNDNQVTVMCGLSKGLLNKARAGQSDIGMAAVAKILRKYQDLSRVWLLTGEGEMLLPEAKTTGKAKMIRYYPEVEGSAGGVQFMENPDERCIEISIPFCTDCSCAINVHGDSMSPRIRSGQVVLLSEWTEHFIDWGKIYLVVTQSGYRCIKYLFPSADGESITCRSENSDSNPDFNISKDDIARLFIVKGWICRDAI